MESKIYNKKAKKIRMEKTKRNEGIPKCRKNLKKCKS